MVTDLKRRAQELTAANCIAPDLCEKNCCVSFYAGCWLHFLHRPRWKNFHGSSTSQLNNQNDCAYVPATTMMWRRCQSSLTYHLTFSKLLMVSTTSQSWVAWGWCLWTLAQRLMAVSTTMNCCWNDCCQRSANYPILLFAHWRSWTVSV